MFSFRGRLVLVHMGVIITVVMLAALAAYWQLSLSVHGQLDAALLALGETERAMLAESIEQPISIHEELPGSARFSFIRLDRLVQVIDAQGHVLARSTNLGAAQLPTPPVLLARLAANETVFETLLEFGEEPMRMVSIPVHARGSKLAIQVAGSLDDVRNVLKAATILFVVMAVALLVAVGTAGAVLTRRVFRAIDDVVHQVRRIGESNLSERLPHPGTPDEIGRLVDTLNEMLNRLERGFDAQRRFTADASHELRSPLSRLRAEIEVTLRRPRDTAEYVEALRSCMEEVERLTLLVEELLMLARLDAGKEHGPTETVPLNSLVEEVVHRMEPIARERHVQIVVDQSPPVTACIARGPASLILANLLDNSVKFSPIGGHITIRLNVDGSEAVMSVSDVGVGISIDELPHLFERFYRGAAARAGAAPGIGLGLALSQSIVHAYGGRIAASNLEGGGALFTVRLPLAA